MMANEQSRCKEKSFWLHSYGPYGANPPLTAAIKVDVCIIQSRYDAGDRLSEL